uniref:Putative reverse transcriptase domain-containing protein n=1 Tax=Tanacetum cinerariifolium TaxID=118510 RepID=A0A6L2L3J6_TANCI|nr:putative reverse transcriptase domain-containing protein [Tanacetum cinerariifolium]
MDQDSVHMVAALKVHMLKPENGNAPPITQVIEGVNTTIVPTTIKEKAQRRLEMKARSTLLMGIFNEHQLKFNFIKDAKSLLQAVEKRMEHIYYCVENKPEIETLSLDDLYNNLKINEPEVKRASRSNTNTQNVAFVSLNSTSNTNGAVNTSHGVTTANTQATILNSTAIDNLSDAMAMLTMRARRFLKNDRRKFSLNGNETIGFDKSKVECYNCHKRGHFDRECRAPRSQDTKHKESTKRTAPVETSASAALVSCDYISGYDWSDQAEDGPTNFALTAYSSTSSNSKKCKIGLGYNAVPPPYTGNFLPPKPDLSGLEEFVNEPIVSEPTVKKPAVETSEAKASADKSKVIRKNFGPPLIEDWISDSKDEAESKPKIEKKTVKPSFAKIEFVKSKESKTVNTAGPKAVVKVVQGDVVNAVKASACWDKGVIDSRYSKHMIGNMSYLTDYKEIDRGYVAFGGYLKRGKITGRASKDETSAILKTFITGIENLVDHKVKVIRCDNGTEFKNREMNQFCKMKGKFDGKADEGFFVGYSLNSKSFRVLNNRTWIVEENLHIRFSENTPNIAGRNQSNGNAGIKACDDAESKTSQNDGFQPSSDDEKKIDEDPRQESKCKDQEKEDNVNITNNVNDVGTNRVNVVGANTNNELPIDLEMPALEDINTFNFLSDYEDDDEMADMNNLDITIQVSPTLTTRIHKDHLIDQVIGDLHSTTQTRHMSKNLEEHGFVTTIHQRTNHKDLQNYLFACFLSQEEPRKFGVGVPSGAEAVLHGANRFLNKFHSDGSLAMLTVDFSNAFNLVDRTALLHEVRTRCPSISLWVDFLYGQSARLYVGDDHIWSTTGVQQGDPLGPLLFALVLHPLVHRIRDCCQLLFHAWYLDDGTIIGDAKEVAKAINIIRAEGRRLGLELNIKKTEVFWPSCNGVKVEDGRHRDVIVT